MLRVLLHQEVGQRSGANIVQIQLALVRSTGRRIIAVQRLHNGVAAPLGIRLLHLLLRQGDDHLVARRLAQPLAERLDAEIANASLVHRRTDAIGRRRSVELHVDQRAALEVDAQRNAVPEENGQQASHTENEREAEEIPLLPQPVDLYVVKQFHLNSVYAVPLRHTGELLARTRRPQCSTSYLTILWPRPVSTSALPPLQPLRARRRWQCRVR